MDVPTDYPIPQMGVTSNRDARTYVITGYQPTDTDNKDMIYSYLWAQNKAWLTFNGYINHVFDKWSELRPDKPLSKSALANLETLIRLNPESDTEKR